MIVFYILLRGAVKNRGRRKHKPERLVHQRTLKNADFQFLTVGRLTQTWHRSINRLRQKIIGFI